MWAVSGWNPNVHEEPTDDVKPRSTEPADQLLHAICDEVPLIKACQIVRMTLPKGRPSTR
jgi:hypothetical protein